MAISLILLIVLFAAVEEVVGAPQDPLAITLSGIRAEGNRLVNKDGQVVNLRVSIPHAGIA